MGYACRRRGPGRGYVINLGVSEEYGQIREERRFDPESTGFEESRVSDGSLVRMASGDEMSLKNQRGLYSTCHSSTPVGCVFALSDYCSAPVPETSPGH